MTPERREQWLAELRETYSKVGGIDPSGETYKNLIEYLDKLSTPMLEMLSTAQIKWVSMLARNRVTRRAMGIK